MEKTCQGVPIHLVKDFKLATSQPSRFFFTISKVFDKCFRVTILVIASQTQTPNYVDHWASFNNKLYV